MPNSANDKLLPKDYIPLPGSERHPSKGAKLIGPANDAETFKVTIVLRRRTDGPALPDFDYYAKTPPGKQKRLSMDEFAGKYGAHPDDIRKIVAFAENAGLKVVKTHAARRTVEVSGTVAQMSNAFALKLNRYERTVSRETPKKPYPFPSKIAYRGRDGFINVPKDLAPLIVGVFGLDNRTVGHRAGNPGDPQVTNPWTMAQITSAYNFPGPGAGIKEQTIGVIAPTGGSGGYFPSDLQQYFSSIGIAPQVVPVSVDGYTNGNIKVPTNSNALAGHGALTFAPTPTPILDGSYVYPVAGIPANTYVLSVVTTASLVTVNLQTYTFNGTTWVAAATAFTAGGVPSGTQIYFDSNPDSTGETNQDICITAGAAPGANVAVYFSTDTQGGWVDLMNRVIQPESGDFPAGVNPPSVLTSSWSIAPGDDPDGLTYADSYWDTGVTTAALTAMSMAFQDAAVYGITVCIAAGDRGSGCGMTDTYAHVQPPASDPWILSVGGTTLGKYQPANPAAPLAWVEYAWNDASAALGFWGTGGGGVSDYFPLPSYQNNAGIPNSINPVATFNKTGRGVPDVAANASLYSGFSGLYLGGSISGNPGNGTSASTPFWAGLVALLNSNLGYNIGFINAILYNLSSTAFSPMNPLWPDPAYPQLSGCPANNSNDGVTGYPAHAGWDACTGLGSPNGTALLNAFQHLTLPNVYILGGYQSPNIIITDPSTTPPNQPVLIGGLPGGRWDTLLKPSTPYGFSVVVHNDSAVAANNVEVRFWAIPGGVGTNGSLVGTPQTVNIPAFSSLTVTASAPFISAPAGDHLCAVVSLYDPSGGCNVQATTALQIPDPGQDGTHSCSAWRNTDSMVSLGGSIYKFPLGLGKVPIHFIDPIILKVEPVYIPVNWKQIVRGKELAGDLKSEKEENNIPPYLLPVITRHFPSLNLKTKINGTHGLKIEEGKGGEWHLFPSGHEEQAFFEITGEIPKTVKTGDIVVVKITASYPKVEKAAAKSREFYEYIHIVDKIEK